MPTKGHDGFHTGGVSTSSLEPRPAGWYPDPAGGVGRRWHDGQGWTGQVSHGRPPTPLGAPFAKLADWLSWMLMAVAGVNAAVLLLDLWTYTSSDVVAEATAPGSTGLPAYLVAVVFLGLVYAVSSVVTGVLWAVWQYRLARSAPAALRRSPGMHIASWFIPFANWWFPVQNMTDLWRSYGSVRKQHGQVGGPPFFLWWSCWIVAGFFSGAVFLPLLGTTSEMVELYSLMGVVGSVLSALAAVFATMVVRRLSWEALLAHAG